MHILMLAPEPFFEPRGTPFSEYHRIGALTELGHTIDLVTYPFGNEVSIPGLTIWRAPRPPFVRTVRIGPSVAKVPLDVSLAFTAMKLAARVRYDVIHSHEEAGAIGLLLARWLRIPHVYDMHSSLPQQLENFGYSRSRVLRWLFERGERFMVRGSDVVITICQELQDKATSLGAHQRAVLIENAMGGDFNDAGTTSEDVRAAWGIDRSQALILYCGTFERYQGLELLIAAAGVLHRTHPEARVMVVGGGPDQVSVMRELASASGAPIIFTGSQPPGKIASFIQSCDILVSPRIAGTNTPLKIYSYLRSGKPIVATDLPTHTQVLDAQTAVLVPPDPVCLGQALARLLDHPEEQQRIAGRAAMLAATRYSRQAFLARTREAYSVLTNGQGTSATTEVPAAFQPQKLDAPGSKRPS